VFLDNAGALDQMSSDDHPRPGGQRYLVIPEVAELVRGFRERTAGEVELVFLQQPTRSTLETHYHFRRAARYVMATQVGLAAPNRYYPATVRRLVRRPGADGRELAEQIALNEADDQFFAYTAVSAAALRELPGRLERVLAPALAEPGLRAPVQGFLERGGTRADLAVWLEALTLANGLSVRAHQELLGWIEDELIAVRRLSPAARGTGYEELCGLSLHVPPAGVERYAHFAIYRDTLLDELLAALER